MSPPDRPLRRGWTTGTCATAAAKAAYTALLTGDFPDPIEVALPRGERPSFALALTRKDVDSATAGVVKDAGDDPDVTHGALVVATVRAGAPGSGVTFRAGAGVGTVTRAGLPVPPGECGPGGGRTDSERPLGPLVGPVYAAADGLSQRSLLGLLDSRPTP